MPAPTRLSMDLRDGRRGALRRVERALRRHDTIRAAAESLGVSEWTFRHWCVRSNPDHIPAVADLVDASHRIDDESRARRLETMRRLRREGLSMSAIAERVGVSEATVSRSLRRPNDESPAGT